jgi:chromosome segregation ATPase
MASEKSEESADRDAGALALEVKALRALIEDLQAGLGPGVQSSLRERSSELQRLGGELDERRTEAERLQQALDAAEARAADLGREAERWRDAARRGLDEIAERARAAAARFEAETAELGRALNAIRAELASSQAEAAAAAEARDAAAAQAKRRQQRLRALEAEALEREQRRLQMTRSLSWKITAPLRWIHAALQQLMKRGARLRRRMTGR